MCNLMRTVCSTFALIALLATGALVLSPTMGLDTALAGEQHGVDKALVDINTASKTQLERLPGIGQVYSLRIVENRPYQSKEDLLTRGVIPKGTYKKIAERITVGSK